MDEQEKNTNADLETEVNAILTTVAEGRKKRGGQPGNQNARKHGFYANTLIPEQEEASAEALEIRDFGQEVALVRVRLLTLLQDPDTPPELISRTFNHLCRVMGIQRRYRFG